MSQSSCKLLKGKLVLITGATGLVGSDIARVFGVQGAKLVLGYNKRRGEAEALKRRLENVGCDVLTVSADVCDEDAVRRMVDSGREYFGQTYTVIVNNAYPGIKSAPASELGWDDYDRSIKTVLKGAYECVRETIEDLKSNSGSIINIGTSVLWEINKGFAAYGASKGALEMFTRSLARDYGSDGVRANMVSPGPLWNRPGKAQPRMRKPAHMKRTPLGRLGEPSDISAAALFFASDLSRFVTGVNIPVCGGFVMR